LDIFPNPAENMAIIKYNLAERSPVKVELYNSTGTKLKDLVNCFQEKGVQQLSFITDYVPGVYYIRVISNTKTCSRKLVIK
jgi:hypothetical protein